MKKLVLGTITAAMIATTAFSADYTMKVSHVVSASTPKGKAADFLEKRIEELTAGKIDVQVFPNSQLYGDGEEMKALVMDNVQVIMPSLSKFTSIAPEMQLFDLPFLFRDKDHLYKVMDGEVGKILKSKVDAKKQMIALDYWDAGFKHFSTNANPIVLPEDAAGKKYRIQSSKVLEAQFKAIGGNPQVLPFSEVYSALQQGVVDGTENPLSNFYTKKFHEVQSSLTLSSHGYLGYLVVMSDRFWKKLPKDLQEKVSQAMKEATELERKESALEDDKIMAELRTYSKDTNKLEIIELTADQKQQWQKSMSVVYPKFYDVIGEDLIKKAIDTK
ncbi:MAG: DctP family TRAP transporter solute-binding subunit [Aliarcobacter sp.]|nr:DctP family TRAP transporter solute-binding subunit [Aliarcobacter sp.]